MLPPDAYRRFQRTRWTIFAILVVAYMMAFFHRMAPGVVAGDLMQAFHTTGAELGSLAAMYFYIYTAMQLPSGVLADTLGPRVSAGVGSLVADLAWDGILIEGVRHYPWIGYQNGLLVSAGFAGLAVVGAWRLQETHCRNQTLQASTGSAYNYQDAGTRR